MEELVLMQENTAVTTSRLVSNAFGKRHDDVLKSIYNLECSTGFHERNFALMFINKELPNNAIRQDKVYSITRDGFVFLAMGYTGKRAAKFKEDYINAFNEMESRLSAGKKELSVSDMIELMNDEKHGVEMQIASLKDRLSELNVLTSNMLRFKMPDPFPRSKETNAIDFSVSSVCEKVFVDGVSYKYNEALAKIQTIAGIGGNKARTALHHMIDSGQVVASKEKGKYTRYTASLENLFPLSLSPLSKPQFKEAGGREKSKWHLGVFALEVGKFMFYDVNQLGAMKQHLRRYKNLNPDGMRFLTTTRGTPTMKFAVKRIR